MTQTGRGWSKSTFKPGDEVVVDCVPAKNNQPIGQCAGRIAIHGKQSKERNE